MDWNFSNYYLWRNSFPECSGMEQSPIDISTSQDVLEECSIMCQLDLKYKKTECRVNLNKQNLITIEVGPGSFAKYSLDYTLHPMKWYGLDTNFTNAFPYNYVHV